MWLYLVGAILCEVAATLGLRAAAGTGKRAWFIPVGGGYVLSFFLLSLSLRAGMPLGVSYGIWTATGVALTAVMAAALFAERFTRLKILGVALIIVGVVLVETGIPGH
ncbi:cation transporter [Corynebacterium phocae]|uniref:Cation transporter n=2 Tax=Corynebacterium phocae TaxID=161895 RepID=A0A1L7D5Z8_9CORY|nr:cation transporter [Corynebacterium phocae]